MDHLQIFDFNPRSHEGSDLNKMYKVERDTISIHAPTRGATLGCFVIMLMAATFQSTLPRGERHQ